MKRLIVVLILAVLLAMPTMGLADPAGPPGTIPPKPGNHINLGLWNAFLKIVGLSLPNDWCYVGGAVVVTILFDGTPPWNPGK